MPRYSQVTSGTLTLYFVTLLRPAACVGTCRYIDNVAAQPRAMHNRIYLIKWLSARLLLQAEDAATATGHFVSV